MIVRRSVALACLSTLFFFQASHTARTCPCEDCKYDDPTVAGLRGRYWATALVYFAKHKVLAKQVPVVDEQHSKTLLAQMKEIQRSIVDGAYGAAASNITHAVKGEIDTSIPDPENKNAMGVIFDVTLHCLEKGDDFLSKQDVQAFFTGAARSRGLASTNALYKGAVAIISQ
jgi:hypothetical protein